jgi:hypothetical protein
MATDTIDQVEQRAEQVQVGYSHGQHRPLRSYALLTGGFGALFGGFVIRNRDSMPDHVAAGDLLLIGAATHKLARLVAKDLVISFIRAPFTRYEGGGIVSAEVSEQPRGKGLRYALGELLTCPFCMGQWIVAGFVAGLVKVPGPTRVVASTFTALGIADFLQLAYKASADRA